MLSLINLINTDDIVFNLGLYAVGKHLALEDLIRVLLDERIPRPGHVTQNDFLFVGLRE